MVCVCEVLDFTNSNIFCFSTATRKKKRRRRLWCNGQVSKKKYSYTHSKDANEAESDEEEEDEDDEMATVIENEKENGCETESMDLENMKDDTTPTENGNGPISTLSQNGFVGSGEKEDIDTRPRDEAPGEKTSPLVNGGMGEGSGMSPVKRSSHKSAKEDARTGQSCTLYIHTLTCADIKIK